MKHVTAERQNDGTRRRRCRGSAAGTAGRPVAPRRLARPLAGHRGTMCYAASPRSRRYARVRAHIMNQQAFTFECWGVSHPGRVRELNEDRFLMQSELGLWIVADGMGGHDAGEVASAAIIEQIQTMGVPSTAS